MTIAELADVLRALSKSSTLTLRTDELAALFPFSGPATFGPEPAQEPRASLMRVTALSHSMFKRVGEHFEKSRPATL
jgi:hypothetical protein